MRVLRTSSLAWSQLGEVSSCHVLCTAAGTGAAGLSAQIRFVPQGRRPWTPGYPPETPLFIPAQTPLPCPHPPVLPVCCVLNILDGLQVDQQGSQVTVHLSMLPQPTGAPEFVRSQNQLYASLLFFHYITLLTNICIFAKLQYTSNHINVVSITWNDRSIKNTHTLRFGAPPHTADIITCRDFRIFQKTTPHANSKPLK